MIGPVSWAVGQPQTHTTSRLVDYVTAWFCSATRCALCHETYFRCLLFNGNISAFARGSRCDTLIAFFFDCNGSRVGLPGGTEHCARFLCFVPLCCVLCSFMFIFSDSTNCKGTLATPLSDLPREVLLRRYFLVQTHLWRSPLAIVSFNFFYSYILQTVSEHSQGFPLNYWDSAFLSYVFKLLSEFGFGTPEAQI